MKKVVILHAWFATPSDHWYQWLKSEFENRGIDVYIPELKDKEKPELEDWEKCVLEHIEIDDDTSIFAHSLGAVLSLKLIQDNHFMIDKLVTIAGWDFWDLTPEHKSFFQEPINHKDIISKTNERYVVHSDNDPYITTWQAEEYAKRLDAKFKLIKRKRHFTSDDNVKRIPELINIIE